jgi:phage terminase small subunit
MTRTKKIRSAKDPKGGKKRGRRPTPNAVKEAKAPVEEKNPADSVRKPPPDVQEEPEKVPEEILFRQLLSKLPAKRARFVEEYLVDLDATKAAKRTGYSEHTAGEQGRRMLRIAPVRAAIESGKLVKSKAISVTAEAVIKELAMIGFADLSDYMTWTPSGRPLMKTSKELGDKSRVIESIKFENVLGGSKVTLKLHDKTKSLELLSRHLGLLHDKTELTNPDGSLNPFTNLERSTKLMYLIELATRRSKGEKE